MKKLNLFIATLIIVISACKKGDFATTPEQTPTIIKKSLTIGDSVTQVNCANYSFLKFTNRETFINTLSFLADSATYSNTVLDYFSAAFSFSSIRNQIELLPNDSLKLLAYGDVTNVLATVVSVDSIIQVDSVAFLLDFDDSMIYELYPVTCNNLSVLKQKQEVNNDSMYVFRYSFHDPVFHPSGYEEFFGKKGLFRWLKKVFGGCEELWPTPGEKHDKKNYNTFTSPTTVEGFAWWVRHQYRGYAIYFEIKHEWYHYKGSFSSGTPHAVPVAYSHQDNWKEYCGPWGGHANWPNSVYGLNAYFDFKTYKSTNRLARNHNQVKTYAWFFPPGNPVFPVISPHGITVPNLNF